MNKDLNEISQNLKIFCSEKKYWDKNSHYKSFYGSLM